jgi:hypothetical protein
MQNWLWIVGGWWALVFWWELGMAPNKAAFTGAQWGNLVMDGVLPMLAAWAISRAFAGSHLRDWIKSTPADTVVKINPRRWKLEHQLAWVVACILGGGVGVLSAYNFFLSRGWAITGDAFLQWLQHTEFYWHWMLLGAVIAGLSFYLARLLKA